MAQWVAPEFTRPVGTARAAAGEPYDWSKFLLICGALGAVVLAVLAVRWIIGRRRARG